MNYIEQFMEDNDIEINEEFYVLNENGGRIKKLEESRFYFGTSLFLFKKGTGLPQDYVLCELLLGKYIIEKIPQKPKTVWDLKDGDEYYYIDYYGEIKSVVNECCDEDLNIVEFGNAFFTKEEAEHELERRKCEAILLKYGTRDMMSFEDYDDKYYIMYDNTGKNVDVSCCTFRQNQGVIYFKTIELAQKAIEEVGEDRLKKYVFNVKE